MSQVEKNATPTLAKDYLSRRKIPELFEVNLYLNKKKYILILFSGFNDWTYD
jgi:hypothetical protein